MRIDLLLVEKGLATSRTRAQELIATGRVFLKIGAIRKAISKPSYKVEPEQYSEVEVQFDPEANEFVSRGGQKMKGALEHAGLKVANFKVLDIGISTGGFADCLLQSEASVVVGIDVGHGQLHEKLKKDPRVRLLEGVNARELAQSAWREKIRALSPDPFDLVVIDVSFISLTLVLPEVIQYLNESGRILALVKPQFEVGREGLGKNGIVKDEGRYRDVEEKIRRTCQLIGLEVEDYFASSILGADGNREFFVLARPAQLSLL